MDYQKIILSGKITSQVQVHKSKGSEENTLEFDIAVSDSLNSEVIFPIVVKGLSAEIDKNQVSEGNQALVEGKVETDPKGRFHILADTVQFESSSEEEIDRSKLLF